MARRAKSSPSAVMTPGGRSESDYQAEDDCRTLERAEEVRGDPSRYKRVVGHARQKIGMMQRLVGGSARGKSRGKAPSRARMRGR